MSTHDARIDALKKQAEKVFPGSPEEFVAAWPSIKSEWQRQETIKALQDTSGDPVQDFVDQTNKAGAARPNPFNRR